MEWKTRLSLFSEQLHKKDFELYQSYFFIWFEQCSDSFASVLKSCQELISHGKIFEFL